MTGHGRGQTPFPTLQTPHRPCTQTGPSAHCPSGEYAAGCLPSRPARSSTPPRLRHRRPYLASHTGRLARKTSTGPAPPPGGYTQMTPSIPASVASTRSTNRIWTMTSTTGWMWRGRRQVMATVREHGKVLVVEEVSC